MGDARAVQRTDRGLQSIVTAVEHVVVGQRNCRHALRAQIPRPGGRSGEARDTIGDGGALIAEWTLEIGDQRPTGSGGTDIGK